MKSNFISAVNVKCLDSVTLNNNNATNDVNFCNR